MTAEPLTITMTKEEAEDVTYAMADILCWINGFIAGREGTDLSSNGPEGVERLRRFKIRLDDEILSASKRAEIQL